MLRFSFRCLRPCSRTSFHHQPEAQHPKSSAIHKLPADYPIFGPRRKFLHPAAGAAALPALECIARAQTYPSRPVRMIIGFSAGGPIDILARLIGQWLSERLG